MGAVSSFAGVLLLFVAEAFHGGHDPGNLPATLPVYAANSAWEPVHIGQFLGFLLLLVGFVALAGTLRAGRGGTVARLGLVAAVVATAIYGANQAVDGVAVKFVADQWVQAPAAHKADAFLVANAVRHVEIGLTGFSQLTLGFALLAFGLALVLARSYPRLLAWGGIALGAVYVAAGVLVARDGFTVVGLTANAGVVLALWFLSLAVILWRRAGNEATRSAAT